MNPIPRQMWNHWYAGRSVRILSLLALVLSLHHATPATAQRAVIVVIDGARYSETFGGGEATYLPRLWARLRPEGTIWTNYRNNGVTSTVPGHSSILSGTWQTIANDGSERPAKPVLFEYFRKWTGRADSAAWVVVGKAKLDVLAYSDDPAYGAPFGARVALAEDDSGVCRAALRILKEIRPALMLINFPDVDRAGHSADWTGYLSALHRVDSLVGEIWDFLRSDSGFRDNLFFLTNDHGRHLDSVSTGFAHHGDGCEGCRHLMLFGAGGRLRRGYICDQDRSQIDLAPTVGEWLGFPTPLAEGVSLLGDTLRSTGRRGGEEAPAGDLELIGAYPNPFNPVVRIEFLLARGAEVEFRIIDPLGREVGEVSKQHYPAGANSFDINGKGLSSGVYFYELRSASKKEQGRLVLTR